MLINIAESERVKFAEAWGFSEYRASTDPDAAVFEFLKMCAPEDGSVVLDAGCGSGLAGLKLAREHRMAVCWQDITRAGLDPAITAGFVEAPLWEVNRFRDVNFDYCLCASALDCVPTDMVALSVVRLLESCRVCWFRVATRQEQLAYLMDKPIRGTVMPFQWWLNVLDTLGRVDDARDLCGDAAFVVRGR